MWALGDLLLDLLSEGRAGEGRDGRIPEIEALKATAPLALTSLLERLLAPEPTDRPGLAEVAEECDLIAPSLPGDDVGAWAWRVVTALLATRPPLMVDDWCGVSLSAPHAATQHAAQIVTLQPVLAAPQHGSPSVGRPDPMLAAAAALTNSMANPSAGPPQLVPDLSKMPTSVQHAGEKVQDQVSRAWFFVAGLPFGFAMVGLGLMLLRNPLAMELISNQLRHLGLSLSVESAAPAEPCVAPAAPP